MNRAALLLITLTALPAWADSRKEIEACYNRMNEAAHYKFLEGMLATRSSDFKAFDAKGRPLNLRFEKRQLSSLLQRAISIQSQTQVVKYKETANTVETEIADTMKISAAESPESPIKTMVLSSSSRDFWSRTAKGWRIKETRILSQSLQPSSP